MALPIKLSKTEAVCYRFKRMVEDDNSWHEATSAVLISRHGKASTITRHCNFTYSFCLHVVTVLVVVKKKKQIAATIKMCFSDCNCICSKVST